MRVLFGGFSAGGFGTLYNYHYVLDDLQWAHTAAYPDAALALDNGEALGVRGLGAIVASDTPPIGWGARSYLPPYCFRPTAASARSSSRRPHRASAPSPSSSF